MCLDLQYRLAGSKSCDKVLSTTKKREKRHSPEKIGREILGADRSLTECLDVAAVLRQLNVAEATYSRWRNRLGGPKSAVARKLAKRDFLGPSGRLPAFVQVLPAVDISARDACRLPRHARLALRFPVKADTPEDRRSGRCHGRARDHGRWVIT